MPEAITNPTDVIHKALAMVIEAREEIQDLMRHLEATEGEKENMERWLALDKADTVLIEASGKLATAYEESQKIDTASPREG